MINLLTNFDKQCWYYHKVLTLMIGGGFYYYFLIGLIQLYQLITGSMKLKFCFCYPIWIKNFII